jgi:hypothetical protein
MCSKIYGSIVLILAVVLGALVVNVSIENVDKVMMLIKFFDVMIPILAVGALIKYIFCSSKKGCCCCCGKCGSNDKNCSSDKSV